MAKCKERNLAISMRLKGMSYSQIRSKLTVSKSSLSIWLQGYPLSESRIRELRDNSAERIEHFRATMKAKRDTRLNNVYAVTKKQIGAISKRELFLCGIFLYWAEGTKASRDSIILTNTDPAMLRFFIVWLGALGVEKGQMRVHLHLYEDMDCEKETRYWSRALSIPIAHFKNPYIKKSSFEKRHNYKGRIGHGTCNLRVFGRDLYESVLSGVQCLRDTYGGIDFAPKIEI